MSDFDLSTLQPIPNNWVATHLTYSGKGKAEFSEPKGQVLGFTNVEVSENGNFRISMKVEKIEYDGDPLPLGLQQLLSGEKPREVDGRLELDFPPLKYNTCVRLEVETNEGKVIAKDFDAISWSFSANVESGTEYEIHFAPHAFEFHSSIAAAAVYWATPLCNFVSDFQQRIPELAFHPLRIFPSRVISEDVPSEKREVAELIANQKNSLIAFKSVNEFGFIEPLADYKERTNKLKNQEAILLTTAVMVGAIGNQRIEFDDVKDWFPYIYVDLLSFATGVEVGIPWIEIRGSAGQLVRRHHLRLGSPMYVNGARVIDEVFNRGISSLLTDVFTCDDVGESFLSVAMRLTTKGGRYSQSVEDKMNYLCRAFETLSAHYGFQKQNLLGGLDTTNRAIISRIVSEAISKINAILPGVGSSGDAIQASYLRTIQGRFANAANQDLKFGLSVIELLDYFGLQDARLMEAYYMANPRSDGMDWASLLSQLRGRAIHIGYYDFKQNSHDIEEVWTVIQHLHDILTRILLMILDYKGGYQPTVMPIRGSEKLDWVQPTMSVARLGYGKEKVKYRMMTISRDVKPTNANAAESKVE